MTLDFNISREDSSGERITQARCHGSDCRGNVIGNVVTCLDSPALPLGKTYCACDAVMARVLGTRKLVVFHGDIHGDNAATERGVTGAGDVEKEKRRAGVESHPAPLS